MPTKRATVADLRDQHRNGTLTVTDYAKALVVAADYHSGTVREYGHLAPEQMLASDKRDYQAHTDEFTAAEAALTRLRIDNPDDPAFQVNYSSIVNTGSPPAFGQTRFAEGRALTREQRAVDFVQDQGLARPGDENLDLGKYLTGLATGRWDSSSENERRAMAEGAIPSGGAMVPSILASWLIDLARNRTRVIEAGATIQMMPNQILNIAKWSGDPSSAWHTEGAVIAPSDALLSRVNLTAKTLPAITVVSRELIEDAPNVGDELARSFALSFAIAVDKAALYGSGVLPQPLGVKNTTGITVQSMGTNGLAPANYDPFIDAVGTLQDANEQPNGGIIVSPRTVRELNKLKDTQNRYLTPPPVLNALPFLPTNQVPNNLTQGTASTASDAFVADWSQLIIGVRTELVIEPLKERYVDYGQIGLIAWWRGDIVVARPAAFVNITGIL